MLLVFLRCCFPLTLLSSSIIEQDVGKPYGRCPEILPFYGSGNKHSLSWWRENVHRILKSPEEDALYSLGVVRVEIRDSFL